MNRNTFNFSANHANTLSADTISTAPMIWHQKYGQHTAQSVEGGSDIGRWTEKVITANNAEDCLPSQKIL